MEITTSIDNLPFEVLSNIFSYLTPKQTGTAARVCRLWRALLEEHYWTHDRLRQCGGLFATDREAEGNSALQDLARALPPSTARRIASLGPRLCPVRVNTHENMSLSALMPNGKLFALVEAPSWKSRKRLFDETFQPISPQRLALWQPNAQGIYTEQSSFPLPSPNCELASTAANNEFLFVTSKLSPLQFFWRSIDPSLHWQTVNLAQPGEEAFWNGSHSFLSPEASSGIFWKPPFRHAVAFFINAETHAAQTTDLSLTEGLQPVLWRAYGNLFTSIAILPPEQVENLDEVALLTCVWVENPIGPVKRNTFNVLRWSKDTAKNTECALTSTKLFCSYLTVNGSGHKVERTEIYAHFSAEKPLELLYHFETASYHFCLLRDSFIFCLSRRDAAKSNTGCLQNLNGNKIGGGPPFHLDYSEKNTNVKLQPRGPSATGGNHLLIEVTSPTPRDQRYAVLRA